MNLFDSLHFLHRAWRYRLRSEKFGVGFLLGRDLGGKAAVDIGANRGIYSYWMHKRRAANVVAFEPQPELCVGLERLKERFRLERLEIVNAGLSDKAGTMTLWRPHGHWPGASYVAAGHRDEAIETPVTTLDEYFDAHAGRPVSFIKCDVEGHEEQVFRGGQRLLTDDRPDVLFECFDPAVPDVGVFKYLTEIGFAGFCFSPKGFVPVADYRMVRPAMHKHALIDFVFVPEERAAALRATDRHAR